MERQGELFIYYFTLHPFFTSFVSSLILRNEAEPNSMQVVCVLQWWLLWKLSLFLVFMVTKKTLFHFGTILLVLKIDASM